MPDYAPNSGNPVQLLLKDHFADFEEIYDAAYSADYGKFNLDRITEAVGRFVDCGDYSKGVARIKCTNTDCGHEYFLPFSCKQWYLCPSCHQKRLLLFSEHLCEETLLKLPHRQFVFTIPKMLRLYFRHDKKLFTQISRMISDIVGDYYRELSGRELTTGIVVSFQTYGDILRFHPHWHCIILEGGIDGALYFHLPIGDTKPLCEVLRQKVIRFFSRKELLNEQLAASLLSWVNSGFSVDNSVRLLSHDDKARNNLSQYIARNPYSLKKIHYIKEKEQVLYLTQYNPHIGDNIKLFPVLDFIAELTQHIPPKGKHLIRYYGIYSSRTMGKNNASGMLEKFKGKGTTVNPAIEVIAPEAAKAEKKKCNKTWARLIQKVYEVDPMVCPKCGSEMKIIAVITEPLAVQSILRYLENKGLPPFSQPKANSPPGRVRISA